MCFLKPFFSHTTTKQRMFIALIVLLKFYETIKKNRLYPDRHTHQALDLINHKPLLTESIHASTKLRSIGYIFYNLIETL